LRDENLLGFHPDDTISHVTMRTERYFPDVDPLQTFLEFYDSRDTALPLDDSAPIRRQRRLYVVLRKVTHPEAEEEKPFTITVITLTGYHEPKIIN
jgi:hypothetical protein